MATWEEDQKFKRDTIMEIDREYGRTQERERIVAIIRAEHERYNRLAWKCRENMYVGWRADHDKLLYAMAAMADIVQKIQNE